MILQRSYNIDSLPFSFLGGVPGLLGPGCSRLQVVGPGAYHAAVAEPVVGAFFCLGLGSIKQITFFVVVCVADHDFKCTHNFLFFVPLSRRVKLKL